MVASSLTFTPVGKLNGLRLAHESQAFERLRYYKHIVILKNKDVVKFNTKKAITISKG